MMLSEEEKAGIKAWLDQDPVGNAFVIHRAFFEDQPATILVDHPESPDALVVLQEGSGRLAVTATKPDSAAQLLKQLPGGEYHVSSLDLELVPALSTVVEVELDQPAWLFRMERADFRPYKACETGAVLKQHAELIARLWGPDRNAVEYVRSRIEKGPTAGVYVGDELVAWDMTHLLTDKVVMLGFLHVLEGYRGRGFAKTVCTAMCEEVFRMGRMPACHVYQDNEPSIKLTEAMGFRRVKRQSWATIRKDGGPT